MTMKSHWMEYKGKRIFIADYSGFGDDVVALRAEIEQAINMLSQEPEGSALVVANVDGTGGTVANANALKELLPRSAHVARKRAIVGVTGMKRFFLGSFAAIAGRGSVTPFDTIEQALEWIIKE
jgi:hypothetical protein